MKMVFAPILFFLFFEQAVATLRMDISIVRNSGINKGLILTSEVHSTEKVLPGVWKKMSSNTGISFSYLIDFYLPENEMGPSETISVRGYFASGKDTKIPLSESSILIPIGQSIKVEVRPSEGQIYEVILLPRVVETI